MLRFSSTFFYAAATIYAALWLGLLCSWVACEPAATRVSPATTEQTHSPTPPTVSGDYNGDGKPETAWIEPPDSLNIDEMSCGDCVCHIRFSDATIPPLAVPQCIDGTPVNEGDLNHNRTDEIALQPDWFTSCWRSYYLWTLKNNEWIPAIEPIPTHCIQWEEDIEAVSPDPKHRNQVIIHYSALDDETADMVVKSASVPIAH